MLNEIKIKVKLNSLEEKSVMFYIWFRYYFRGYFEHLYRDFRIMMKCQYPISCLCLVLIGVINFFFLFRLLLVHFMLPSSSIFAFYWSPITSNSIFSPYPIQLSYSLSNSPYFILTSDEPQ